MRQSRMLVVRPFRRRIHPYSIEKNLFFVDIGSHLRHSARSSSSALVVRASINGVAPCYHEVGGIKNNNARCYFRDRMFREFQLSELQCGVPSLKFRLRKNNGLLPSSLSSMVLPLSSSRLYYGTPSQSSSYGRTLPSMDPHMAASMQLNDDEIDDENQGRGNNGSRNEFSASRAKGMRQLIDDDDVYEFADSSLRQIYDFVDHDSLLYDYGGEIEEGAAIDENGKSRFMPPNDRKYSGFLNFSEIEDTFFESEMDSHRDSYEFDEDEVGINLADENEYSSPSVWQQIYDNIYSSDEAQQQQNSQDRLKNAERPLITPQNLWDLMDAFDPLQPPPVKSHPSSQDLLASQIWNECESQRGAILRYERILADARARKNYGAITAVQKQLLQWFGPLRDAIEAEQVEYYSGKYPFKHREYIGLLQAEKLAIITAHEATVCALKMSGSATLSSMAIKIADAVEAEVNVQKLLLKSSLNLLKENATEKDKGNCRDCDDGEEAAQDGQMTKIKKAKKKRFDALGAVAPTALPRKRDMYVESNLKRFLENAFRSDPAGANKQRLHVRAANRRAKKLLKSDEEWSTPHKAKLGVALIQMLVDTAKIENRDLGCSEDAFRYEKKWLSRTKVAGYVSVNRDFYRRVVLERYYSLATHSTRFQPMVVPPKEWKGTNDGAYYALQGSLMRTRGCKPQLEALESSSLQDVYDALNALGRVAWTINHDILSVAKGCWGDGIALGDIPPQANHEMPRFPVKPERLAKFVTDRDSEEFLDYAENMRVFRRNVYRYKRIKQKNMDRYGLRCSAMLKLDQAEKFKYFSEIYFPYNIDFRGRAYPIPPHLSNIGSDLCRGLLKFSLSKPLGERGFYWLKVHLANLAGADKMCFDERAAFTEANMEKVRASVDDPFGNDRWWMKCEDPFQALATCHEIVRAMDSGDPSSYRSALPVHMDGSCNGLQHYAALGRDRVGGKAVNLCECDIPQDVYAGVMDAVIDKVAQEANIELDLDPAADLSKGKLAALKRNKAAKLVDGYIDRGVVKRTVMTSVYGVTYIGAKRQIQEKLEEKLEASGIAIDELESSIYDASGYLTSVTMEVMGDLFIGAKRTMHWLTSCARLISAHGQPIAWISPAGVPVVQPYRQAKQFEIVTLLQKMTLTKYSDDLPVHKQRQVSAFPPNYIHSLDSSHMLLTALEMDRRGLTFSAVHDSFWTHACDVDEMSDVLRETFVKLYEQPLLEDLKKNWELRYPDIEFPDLPERGDLDLSEVKKAPYFFQ